jgi:hypothetical protein
MDPSTYRRHIEPSNDYGDVKITQLQKRRRDKSENDGDEIDQNEEG